MIIISKVKEINVCAWDNGFDYEKIVIGKGPKNRVTFPSRHEVVETKGFFEGFTPSKEDKVNLLNIVFNGDEYRIGKYAYDMAERLSPVIYDSKFKMDTEKAKFIAGVNYLSPKSKNIRINTLVVGVSLTNSDYKDEYQNCYEGRTLKYKVPGDPEERSIFIDNVVVMYQGQGAFINEMLDFDGEPISDELINSRYGIMDLGGKTLDIFISKGVEPVEKSQAGLGYGVFDAFDKAERRLNLPLRLIEKVHYTDEEVRYDNKMHYKEVKKVVKESIAETSKETLNEVNRHWMRQWKDLDFVLVCGGAAKIFYENIKDEIPVDDVRIPDEPIFANAYGYYKWGVYKDLTANQEEE